MATRHDHIAGFMAAEPAARSLLSSLQKDLPIQYLGVNRFYPNGEVAGLYSHGKWVVDALDLGCGFPFADSEGFILKSGVYGYQDALEICQGQSFDPTGVAKRLMISKSVFVVSRRRHYSEMILFGLDESKLASIPASPKEFRFVANKVTAESVATLDLLSRSPYKFSLIGKRARSKTIDTGKLLCLPIHTEFGVVVLPARQMLILEKIAACLPNRVIASQLNISVKSVENIVEKLKDKLQVFHRWELAELYNASTQID